MDVLTFKDFIFINLFNKDKYRNKILNTYKELENTHNKPILHIFINIISTIFFDKDKEVTLAAIKVNKNNYKLTSPKLRTDKDFMLDVLRIDNSRLEKWVPITMLFDSDFMIKAAQINPKSALKNAIGRVHNHPDFIIATIKVRDKNDFKTLNYDLRDNEHVAIAAIKEDVSNFQYVSNRLKTDKNFLEKLAKENIFIPPLKFFLKSSNIKHFRLFL